MPEKRLQRTRAAYESVDEWWKRYVEWDRATLAIPVCPQPPFVVTCKTTVEDVYEDPETPWGV